MQTTVLIAVVLYGFLKHHKASHSRNDPIEMPDYRKDSQSPIQEETQTTNNDEIAITDTNPPKTITKDHHSDKRRVKINRSRSTASRRHRLNSRLRFAITLTIMYCACTVPFILTMIVDATIYTASQILMFSLSRIPMYIYTTLCPVIMVKYLPRLKNSVLKLFQKMESCCKK